MTRPTDDELAETILRLAAERGDERTLGPMDVARRLGGDHPEGWGPLMQPIRRVAVQLMKDGRLVITRKGRPVDPDDFRGVYRLRLPGHEGAGQD
ncbi:DUF3253 domain-containing protein [Bosea sp. (in: a-proteobacteria)]|uniref:DUF3253 domain-containing protein n=1 Tax=Bosea sp. (in: a-proteobacteria) TaxID=1871050 RepID=UPI0025BE5F91|nr:DUF3253 domain-containing protein [Bosea sp. (in: a-proteobacteria)]MBR3190785.1 DUF3253 domain-containing protein [Bosea sp. (in: a-proteobacteria)]